MTGTALKSPNNCPFLIFTDQAELLAAEQLPARSRTGNIKSVFTDLPAPQNGMLLCWQMDGRPVTTPG